MKYLIREGEPFTGSIQSILWDDGIVAYTDGLSLSEYEAERGLKLKAISEAEWEALTKTYLEGLITAPVEETPEAFDYALCVLPPCRWQRVRGVEIFHLSERLTHDLVHWHAKLNGRCYTFTDRETLAPETVATKVAEAAHLLEPA